MQNDSRTQEKTHNQRWKKLLSALLLVSMLCTLVCGISVPVTAASGMTLAQLQAKFPEGKYWNGGNADKYTSYACTCHNQGICINDIDPCNCNHFQGGTQCNGFARKIAYDAYGSHLSTWQTTTSKSYVESLKPGDVVYNSSPHWFMVISVNADSVTVGECNWGSRCVIKWSRTVKKSTIKGYSGLKIFIAPYSLTGGSAVVDTCTCSSSYAGTYTCITSSAPLLIRSGHGTNYGDIGSIPSGASVSVTKANGSWAHVTYNGVSGYASMEYLVKKHTTTSAYPLPFKCYPLKDSQHAADAYDAVNGNHIGYIYNTDYCTVKEVYSNGWCLVNCPWNSSTKDVYTWTGNFLNTSQSPYTFKMEKAADTYIRLGSSSKLGWVDAGDVVTIVDNSYSNTSPYRTQIIYPHTDGTYRCAWVASSALVHSHTPGAAATCTTSQICTTCDALLVNAYGHNPGTGATCTTSQTCTRCGDVIVDALDHNPGAAATCTAAQKCTRCGVTIVNAKGHTPGAAATCTTAQKCTVCGVTIANAKGHNYTAGDYTDPAHPHKIYNTCSCGAQKDSGQTAYVSTCESCNPTFEITFVTNGGTPNILPHYKKNGEKITLASLTRSGYTFVGWDTDSSADTAVYNAGQDYTVNGDATLYAVWKSSNVSVTSVSLNKSSATIDVGDTLNLTATVAPSNATNKAVTWTSSNPSVATVTNGSVTALKAGTATITATTVDGSKTSACVVTVEDVVTSYEAYVYTEAKKTVVQGSQFTYTVSLAGSYDGFSFEVASGNGLIITDITTTNSNINIDEVGDKWMISVLGGLAKNNAEKEELVTVTVQVAPDAELGARNLPLSNLMVSNESGDKVSAIKYEYATIEITDQIPGDINGDGTFDYYDVSKLYAYYRNKTTLSESIDKDINGDGGFDYYDVSKLYAIYRGKANFN